MPYLYSKSKVLVATVTHATLYAFVSDVARSCKTSVKPQQSRGNGVKVRWGHGVTIIELYAPHTYSLYGSFFFFISLQYIRFEVT